MINVLFIAAEAAPFAKTGGLADVVASLPKFFNKKNVQARVILPQYGFIPAEYTEKMEHVHEMTVPVGWRNQYCGIKRLDYDGAIFYFLDNEYYFKRPEMYGCFDDGERFAFFCRAVLEALPHLDFTPQILHCHDWHTGMVSVLLAAQYRLQPFYQDIRTVFTIHNMAYQGIFNKEILTDLLGLGWEYFTDEGVKFNGQVSFLKGGLAFADRITTVSKAYAEEVQSPEFGEGLDGFLRAKRIVVSGILNGIDPKDYNPGSDPMIFVNYNGRCLKRKQENKTRLQEALNLPASDDLPLVGIVSSLTTVKGLDLLIGALDGLLALDVQLAVLGTGDERYQNLLARAAAQYPERLAVRIMDDNSLAHKIYAGADIMLMPSYFEPGGTDPINAMRYGTIPIVRSTGSMKDVVRSYRKDKGISNGFSFSGDNDVDMLSVVQQAVDLYRNKKVWSQIMRNAMKSNYSWKEAGAEYQKLYRQLLRK